ncbi:hypothetical protein [Belliella aquatica]|uniref:Uncharacterized protein n=1 Tax=Belliella aquatica TaxID=1323734 RepID=A0ABQ1MER9_9BACT|nr:hypothetical protein [Belliella aquatica]MCH7405155.1 hypothetical protein [Belliella aquatica]GGC39301.1 hypothetical protein GCM10010993_17600 [Belliella aquatica]
MEKDKILHVPLLNKKWKIFAYFLFPAPILAIVILSLLEVKLTGDAVSDLGYAFWAMGAIILILTAEEKEDEMIKHFRLQAFQTGFYWLVWGLGFLIVVHVLGNFTSELISGPKISAPLVMFLLSSYVLGALKYQIWKSNQIDEHRSK